ncbi:winged helix-turn-helix transcriptional regulator [Aggregatimonas sangjinii]|uniref:Winged helix-turn-helix transcriptional regulator n=1 Tax=Aggregatimonas sangjinii TaxID=2583587 RepID=A0A5B7SNK8_9FLAO|nr:MarR family winged helix-turn-helix transcriptional regulator [Aggregatimonas sangjinii]QCW98998.1 winged helix-turn-helix transcriptional regulator [Aggregatimonas sangjinii]
MQNNGSYHPKECISSKVMRLNRIIANIFRKYLKPFGITNSQLSILFVLNYRNDLNQRKLSDLTILEKSSLNRNLTRLQQSDLISKAKFPYIRITEKGRQLVNNIIPEWEKAMAECNLLIEKEGINALNLLMDKVLKK